MDCLDDKCEIMDLRYCKNGPIVSHSPLKFDIKILLLIYKMHLFYESKQKIEIDIIFIYISASIPSHINGLPVFQVTPYFILDINGLELLQNNQIVQEVIQNIKYYLFIKFLFQKHQEQNQILNQYIIGQMDVKGSHKYCVHHKYKLYLDFQGIFIVQCIDFINWM
eukprot:478867_1